MKKNIQRSLIMVVLVLAGACASGSYATRDTNRKAQTNVVQLEQDQEEHQLLIIDVGYNRWSVMNAKPIGFYSPTYYRQWNLQYVQAWNALANQAVRYGADFPFENQINYDPATDYGVALEYELFTYFQYIAARYSGRYDFPRPVAGYLGT